MVFEHFAVNINDIHSVVRWYVDNLGLIVVSQQEEPPFMTFLADSSGRVIMELYHRPDERINNFKTQHPLTFHVAFVSEKAEKDKNRLLDLGASFVEEVVKNDGSLLVMLRDPWGMPLQLCERAIVF